MKLRTLVPYALSACCVLFAGALNAQSTDTHLYIVHGASGRQLSSSMNPELPVDVLVNDSFCLEKGEQFGDIKGPFSGPSGVYDFKVSLASTLHPCSNPTVIEVPNVSLNANSSYYAVVALNSSNKLTGYLYGIDLSAVAWGQTRVLIANASDESLTAALSSGDMSNSLDYIAPGKTATAMAPSGMYTGSIFPAGSKTPLAGPFMVNLDSRNIDLYFLAGSAKYNSVQVLHSTIRSVF